MAYLDVRGLCESDLYKVHIFERLLVCLGYSFKWLHGSGGGRFSFVTDIYFGRLMTSYSSCFYYV